jgi:hypothetical protein
LWPITFGWRHGPTITAGCHEPAVIGDTGGWSHKPTIIIS